MATRMLLAGVPLFAELGPSELESLAALARDRRYRADQVVFHESDPGTALYVIEEGEVKIALSSPEGREIVLGLLGRGEFFGELALLDGEPRSADAVTTAPSRLVILEREAFMRFATAHPRVTMSLLAVLSRRLRRTDQFVQDAAFLDVRSRLIKVLLELADTRGESGPQGVVVRSKLTQGALAGMVGTTRESVNKWLRYYAARGLVRHDRGRLTLPDVGRLRTELR